MEEPVKIPLYDPDTDTIYEYTAWELHEIIACNQSVRHLLENMRKANKPMLAPPKQLHTPYIVAPYIRVNKEKTFFIKEDTFFCLNAANVLWDTNRAEYWRDDVFEHIGECVMAYVGPTGRDVMMLFPGTVEGIIENHDDEKAVKELLKKKVMDLKTLLAPRYADNEEWQRTLFMLATHHTVSHDPGAKIWAEYFRK